MELRPDTHEHGLATSGFADVATDLDRAWELFIELAGSLDPDAPSRKAGWPARTLVARLGQWEGSRSLADMVADAHDGDAGYYDADAADEMIRSTTEDLPYDQVLASLTAARNTAARWLASDGPDTWALVHTSSQLGPLPVLTVLNAMAYQLSVAALDLEPCGAHVPDELLGIGLVALVDTSGALAARNRMTGSVLAVTPERIVGVGSHAGQWRTRQLDGDPDTGPAVMATTKVVIDATSGRADVGRLYRSGALGVRDLPGLLRLAPALEGVPGLPPLGAIGRAMAVVGTVGGLLGRLRR